MKVAIYLSYVALLVAIPLVRRLFLDLRRPQQVFVLLLLGLVLAGQIYRDTNETYPFVKWGMYSKDLNRARTKIEYYEYQGIQADGGTREFPMYHLIRTFGSKFEWQVAELVDDLRAPETEAERREIQNLLERTIRGAWSQYRSRHPEFDFRAVRIFERIVPMNDFRDDTAVERSFVLQVDLG